MNRSSMGRMARAAAVATLVVPAAFAQDSVSKAGACLPGDAVRPWDDSAAATGSEQTNTYVVDLSSIASSWGNGFGVAPIAKSSKSASGFSTSQFGAQAISRKVVRKQPFAASSYSSWSSSGFGVNNNPAVNDAGTPVNTTGRKGAQFATVLSEFGTTDFGAGYDGAVTTIVNIDPSNTSRLYVKRVQTAVNSADDAEDMGSINVGGVDELGNTVFRSDDFGILIGPVTSGLSGAASLVDDNYYIVDAAARNGSVRNVINNTFAAPMIDGVNTTTKWAVRNAIAGHNTPTLMPESVAGANPILMGSNFSTQYVRGPNFGAMSADLTHLDVCAVDQRGNIAYTSKNHGQLSSTHGMGAMLIHTSQAPLPNVADSINVWGLNATGGVTVNQCFTLPASLSDPTTGFSILKPAQPNSWQFDHYHSQVAFNGGNGQVAINVDPSGNLLLAAEMEYPSDTGNQHADNAIPVARMTPGGSVSWVLAAYTNATAPTPGGLGKPILDSAGGLTIGNLVSFTTGPSISAPMIDAGGNVWFLSAYALTGGNVDVGLFRAVYDAAAFDYELELVLSENDVILGSNTNLNYQISFLEITDSNSVGSGTAWSSNITEDAFLGYNQYIPSFGGSEDPRNMGGLVLQASITYDVDGAFTFDDCASTPGTTDEEYNVLLYVGPTATSGVEEYSTGCSGSGGIVPRIYADGQPNNVGVPITLSIESAVGGGFMPPSLVQDGSALVFIGQGQASVPFFGPCKFNILTPFIGLEFLLPLGGTFQAPGQGFFDLPITTVPGTIPPGTKLCFQAFIIDSNTPGPRTFSNTNGVELTWE